MSNGATTLQNHCQQTVPNWIAEVTRSLKKLNYTQLYSTVVVLILIKIVIWPKFLLQITENTTQKHSVHKANL